MEQIKIKKRLNRTGTCPACKKRSLLHHCIENGVKAVYRAGADLREIWEADLYRCPGCGNLVLTDFGDHPQWTKRTGWLQGQGLDVLDWLARIEREARARGKLGLIYVTVRGPVRAGTS